MEIFDSKGVLVFNQSFNIDSIGVYISPEAIITDSGKYVVKVTIDHNITKEKSLRIDFTVKMISVTLWRKDEQLSITISNKEKIVTPNFSYSFSLNPSIYFSLI